MHRASRAWTRTRRAQSKTRTSLGLAPIDDARRELEARERSRNTALEIDEREPALGMLLRDVRALGTRDDADGDRGAGERIALDHELREAREVRAELLCLVVA